MADTTPAIEAERLLPCPFCGSAAFVEYGDRGGRHIECESCGASMPDEAAWNRRTPPAQAPEAVPLVEDTARLDFIEANPDKFLRHHKRRWFFVALPNYECETHKTVREAIDAARSSAPGSAVEVETKGSGDGG